MLTYWFASRVNVRPFTVLDSFGNDSGADIKDTAFWKGTDECLTGQLTGFEGSPWESLVNGLNFVAN